MAMRLIRVHAGPRVEGAKKVCQSVNLTATGDLSRHAVPEKEKLWWLTLPALIDLIRLRLQWCCAAPGLNWRGLWAQGLE